MTRAAALALVTAVALLAAACASDGARTYHGTYISLGDSIAAGNGASDPAATSFAALLARDEGGLPLRNLAVAGATTRDVIEKQLPAALAQQPPVAFVTISAGGNDLAALIPNATCTQDPLPPSCPLDAALAQVARNMDEILQALRHAFPDTPIVLLLYPNFFSGTGDAFEAPAQRVLPHLDDVLARTAARYPHTAVATAAAAFEGRGAALTHLRDPKPDPHPTDAGHRLIADAFVAALRRVR